MIGKAQRELVWNVLEGLQVEFENLDVLEVNCGTGVDAVEFLKRASNVTATDISSEMIDVCRSRMESLDNVTLEVLDVKKLTAEGPNYDMIFSNFGGLNCLDSNELSNFLRTSKQRLKPNGLVVLVIMPRYCIWEMIYFLAKFSPRKAFRRLNRNGVLANVDGVKVRTYYHNPQHVQSLSGMKLKSISPIGFKVPPSYLEDRYKSAPAILDKWLEWDKTRYENKKYASFSDHYCIVLEKL